jgi:hypothetical protein
VAWDFLKDSSDATALKQFVERFPTSVFRAQAEERIAHLIEKSAPATGPSAITCPTGEAYKDGTCVGKVASDPKKSPQAKCFVFQGRQFCE